MSLTLGRESRRRAPAAVRAHTRIPGILEALRRDEGLALDAYWIPTEQARDTPLEDFDAIWILPGSPYKSQAGALHATKIAREKGIAHLGTCGGFQHAMLEFAHNVCGRTTAAHGEDSPDADDLLIVELACSLAGHEDRPHRTRLTRVRDPRCGAHYRALSLRLWAQRPACG